MINFLIFRIKIRCWWYIVRKITPACKFHQSYASILSFIYSISIWKGYLHLNQVRIRGFIDFFVELNFVSLVYRSWGIILRNLGNFGNEKLIGWLFSHEGYFAVLSFIEFFLNFKFCERKLAGIFWFTASLLFQNSKLIIS